MVTINPGLTLYNTLIHIYIYNYINVHEQILICWWLNLLASHWGYYPLPWICRRCHRSTISPVKRRELTADLHRTWIPGGPGLNGPKNWGNHLGIYFPKYSVEINVYNGDIFSKYNLIFGIYHYNLDPLLIKVLLIKRMPALGAIFF